MRDNFFGEKNVEPEKFGEGSGHCQARLEAFGALKADPRPAVVVWCLSAPSGGLLKSTFNKEMQLF